MCILVVWMRTYSCGLFQELRVERRRAHTIVDNRIEVEVEVVYEIVNKIAIVPISTTHRIQESCSLV